jgi:hypothetical protein
MANPRIGVIRLVVDGEWDMDDLRALSESLSETYGLFYPLVAEDEEVRKRLQDLLRKQFWSGDISTRHFGQYMYRAIPRDESLKLKSFNYASLGAMEIGGVLVVLLLLARVARAWIAAGDEFLGLWKKVEKYFDKTKTLKKPRRTFELDDEIILNTDEARVLVFEVGEKLGFDALSCDRLIAIIGNPISALKFLVAAGREGHKLAVLDQNGLLQLPSPAGEAIMIQGPDRATRRTRSGAEVVVKKSRRKKSTGRPP